MISAAPASVSGSPRGVPWGAVRDLPAWRAGLEKAAKDHRYFEIVAETLGFESHALLLENAVGEVHAILPCFFVEQDLVLASPAPVRAAIAALRRIFPGCLRLKILMAGCPAGEGHLVLVEGAPLDAVTRLHHGLLKLARERGARMVVWKDFPASTRALLGPLKTLPDGAACAHFASMPATRLPLDFASFDDYLARHLSHAMRKNLRRKFKALPKFPPLTMTVTNDLGADADEALGLYEQVFARSPLQFERLTKSFLEQLAARMPDRVRFFLWRQDGQLVAFSLCLVHDGVLYDEYLGLDYRVALDLHLYFVTFRDLVTWALAEGLAAYHSTPLNYTPKRHLGFDLAPLDLYATLPWPRGQRLVRPLLQRMSPTRAEPVLATFRNARELTPEP